VDVYRCTVFELKDGRLTDARECCDDLCAWDGFCLVVGPQRRRSPRMTVCTKLPTMSVATPHRWGSRPFEVWREQSMFARRQRRSPVNAAVSSPA